MKRVNKILELITEPYSTLIDIGSDHGYLGIDALKHKKVKEVLNVDISKNCLDNSKRNFAKHNILSYASFYVSDGFTNLKNIPDNSVAVMAGLGTKTMLKILQNNLPQNLNNIICLPHNPPILLRKWALDNNWDIVSELYFQDKKQTYLILKLRRSNSVSNPVEKPKNYDHKETNIYIGNTLFLKLQTELSFNYWNNFQDKILLKPHQYLLDWEKEFLITWKTYSKSLELK